MKFGEKVRKARLETGLSQKHLAVRTGIALRTIQNYEMYGKLPKQREYYHSLAEALNMEVNVLLDENAEFVLKATENYGSRGNAQAEKLIAEISGLYAGGELADEDMDAMMQAIQEAYWIAKKKNRKFVPMKYRAKPDQ